MGRQEKQTHFGSKGWPMWSDPKKRATVAQIDEKVHAGSDRKVSEFTEHHILLCVGPQTSRGSHVGPCVPLKPPTMAGEY